MGQDGMACWKASSQLCIPRTKPHRQQLVMIRHRVIAKPRNSARPDYVRDNRTPRQIMR